ncbi:unnamed protein product [Fusarium graminearum]|nr:unnamed protein product [Fusarium graminearum]
MTAGGRSMAPSHGVIRLMEHQSTSVCVKFGIPVYLDYMILIEACRVVSGAQSEKGETNSAGKQECEARLAPPTITQFKGKRNKVERIPHLIEQYKTGFVGRYFLSHLRNRRTVCCQTH